MEKTQIVQEQKKDNSLKVITHILGLLLGFLGPLIIYLVTNDYDAKEHSKKALNWQISLIIYAIVSMILVFVLIGFLMLFALFVLDVVFTIMAAVRANKNELWTYPLSIPFLK